MDQQFITKTLDADGNSLVVRFEFEEDQYPFLMSVSSLLYNIVTVQIPYRGKAARGRPARRSVMACSR